MLSITTITDVAALLPLLPEWERLDASLSPRTPFSSPHWSLAWWRHFSRRRLSVSDALRVLVLRDADGALVAVAPMMATRRPGIAAVAARELQFLGADSYMTELRGPVCRPERSAEVAQALEAHLSADRGSWDWIQWRGLRDTGAVADWLGAKVEGGRASELVDHYLPLPGSWDLFRASLPRNIRESLRKCYNSLARDGHAFALRVVEAPDESEAAIRQFLALHNARSEKTGTVDHIDVFASAAAQRFLVDYARAAAERGELRVFQLVVADTVVATRIGFLLGDELYLYYSGYDVAWSRYSVMTTLVAEAIRWAIEAELRIVNLSTGTDVSKTRWRPEQVTYAGGFQVAPSLRARLAYSAIHRLRDRRAKPGALRPAAARLDAAPSPSSP